MQGNLQVVNIDDRSKKCRNCGADILNISNFSFEKEIKAEPLFWEELCKCTRCGIQFILHYNIFDKNGHIQSRVFFEDLNDPEYNWQDHLTPDQKRIIEEHLRSCQECCDSLSQEQLLDAWLKDILSNLRKKRV